MLLRWKSFKKCFSSFLSLQSFSSFIRHTKFFKKLTSLCFIFCFCWKHRCVKFWKTTLLELSFISFMTWCCSQFFIFVEHSSFLSKTWCIQTFYFFVCRFEFFDFSSNFFNDLWIDESWKKDEKIRWFENYFFQSIIFRFEHKKQKTKLRMCCVEW